MMEIIKRPSDPIVPHPLHTYVVDVTAAYDDGTAARVDMRTARLATADETDNWKPLDVRDGKTIVYATDPEMKKWLGSR